MDDLPESYVLNLFKNIWKAKWFIIILMLLGALIGFVLNKTLEISYYETSATLIINKQKSNALPDETYTQEDLAMYEKVLNTYEELAKSDTIINAVTTEFPYYNTEKLKQMVTISTIPNTFFLKISVQGTVPEDITQIAAFYTQAVISSCYQALPIGNLIIVAQPQLPTKPLTSNLVPCIMIGALLGALIALCFIYVKQLKHMHHITFMNYMTTTLNIGVSTSSAESLRLFMQEVQAQGTVRYIGLTPFMSQTNSLKILGTLSAIFTSPSKVLVIDANPFNHKMTKKLKLTKNAGLHDALTFIKAHDVSALSTSQFLSSYIYLRNDLYIMPLGKVPIPNNLLQEDLLKKLLLMAKLDFDYIFIALPGLEHLSYLQPLTPLIDSLLILMNSNVVEISQLASLKDILPNLNCVNKRCLLTQGD